MSICDGRSSSCLSVCLPSSFGRPGRITDCSFSHNPLQHERKVHILISLQVQKFWSISGERVPPLSRPASFDLRMLRMSQELHILAGVRWWGTICRQRLVWTPSSSLGRVDEKCLMFVQSNTNIDWKLVDIYWHASSKTFENLWDMVWISNPSWKGQLQIAQKFWRCSRSRLWKRRHRCKWRAVYFALSCIGCFTGYGRTPGPIMVSLVASQKVLQLRSGPVFGGWSGHWRWFARDHRSISQGPTDTCLDAVLIFWRQLRWPKFRDRIPEWSVVTPRYEMFALSNVWRFSTCQVFCRPILTTLRPALESEALSRNLQECLGMFGL